MKPFLRASVLLTGALLAGACAGFPLSPTPMPTDTPRVERSSFGELPDGRDAALFTLTGENGMAVEATAYGGIITAVRVPDTDGHLENVVLGFDNLAPYLSEEYCANNPYLGAIIGRYGNRIAEGRFSLDGQTYQLATNNGPNHLHGGAEGFDRKLWDADSFEGESEAGVVFRRTSPDGEEGYPGRLDVEVTYTLTDTNELVVEYEATTTEATPVNLTQHSYFNLAGQDDGDILDHRLQLDAEVFTPVDSTMIPTGERRRVAGTPFDFTEWTPVGARIEQNNQQLERAGGYDHNFVLRRENADPGELVRAARVWEPQSGRLLTVRTTEPGVQFYSGNHLDGTLDGAAGAYDYRSGLALETQHFPNSPNEPGFPSTILRPGETYRSTTVFAFEARETLAEE
ncbi:MAG: galactose-1-epimerase [Bacteroidetes bacterium QH_9_67_14]|nr:MAG: galactose-1-epimerase [Bacteroidetes bacterium QH_9_67_14]